MRKSFLHNFFSSSLYSSQRNRKQVNWRYVFLALMFLSIIALFLPLRWTGPAEKFCQTWLAPSGRLSILAARKIKPETRTEAVNSRKSADIRLQRLLSAISIQLNQLQKQNRQLLKLRKIVSNAPVLVPAHVIGFDSLGLASIEIDKGSFAHITQGLPVIADVPTDLIGLENVDSKIALAGGTLIGLIAYEPGPYTTRVKLMTSPEIKLAAFVVRLENGKPRRITRVRVKGSKRGTNMIADMVPLKHNVKIGDFVILQEYKKFMLPTPMTIGVVSKINIRTDNRLLADLVIQPVIPKTLLDTVYILVPSKEQK